jgi:uncharacterized protein (DUF1684 family)
MKFIYTFLIGLTGMLAFGQNQSDTASAVAFQQELNISYADSAKSPLEAKDLAAFKSLDFYPIDAKYIVRARFIRTKKEKPFAMPTTTERKPMYVKYGELHFTIDGKPLKLNLYQNVAFRQHPKYKNSLFLPFTDRTSGNETYGGGRYIDINIPSGKTVVVDFNQAYNPYCAYNKKYSCPIVPQENDLDVEIRAGVKKFHD